MTDTEIEVATLRAELDAAIEVAARLNDAIHEHITFDGCVECREAWHRYESWLAGNRP